MNKCICCERTSVNLDGWQVLAATNYMLCPECFGCRPPQYYLDSLASNNPMKKNPECRLA